MVLLNVVWVFSPEADKVLMCKRRKNPYLGLYNLPGGHVDDEETGIDAAYRELEEETGIARKHLTKDLHHLMDSVYYISTTKPEAYKVEVYVGKLTEWVDVAGDEDELAWINVNDNFFDVTRFAGKGLIGHIYEHIKHCPELI